MKYLNQSRWNAFVTPFVLAVILFVSLISLQGFSRIGAEINWLERTAKQLSYNDGLKYFESIALSSRLNSLKNIDVNEIPLSGLYNVNYIVDRLSPILAFKDEIQFEILQSRLLSCGFDREVSSKILQYLLRYSYSEQTYNILNLSFSIGLTGDEAVRLLACVRHAPKNVQTNLYFSNKETIAAIFEINNRQAEQLLSSIRGGRTNDVKDVGNFVENLVGVHNFRQNMLKHVMVSPISKDIGVAFEVSGDTFAFVNKVLDENQSWVVNWAVYLWSPE